MSKQLDIRGSMKLLKPIDFREAQQQSMFSAAMQSFLKASGSLENRTSTFTFGENLLH